MVINHKHRFVFFHIPKTGGTALAQFLRTLDGNEPGSRSDRSPYADHISPASIHEGLPELRDYFWWAVVRNPYERMESAYRHKMHRVKDPPAFSDWVCGLTEADKRDPVLTPQSHWLTHGVRAYPYEAVKQIGFLPRLNVSRPCDCVWTEDAIHRFGELYATDLLHD